LSEGQVERRQEVAHHKDDVCEYVPPQFRPTIRLNNIGERAAPFSLIIINHHRFLDLLQHAERLYHLDSKAELHPILNRPLLIQTRPLQVLLQRLQLVPLRHIRIRPIIILFVVRAPAAAYSVLPV